MNVDAEAWDQGDAWSFFRSHRRRVPVAWGLANLLAVLPRQIRIGNLKGL